MSLQEHWTDWKVWQKEQDFFKTFQNMTLTPGGLTDLDYIDLKRLLDMYNPEVVIDVGCWTGLSTIILASHPSVKKCYSVDWFKGLHESTMFFSGKFLNIKNILRENLRTNELEDKVEIIDDISMNAVKNFKHFSADMIFIDANHSFQHASADIHSWWGIIKRGGIMSGHDFEDFIPGLDEGTIVEPTGTNMHTGVIKAAQCFFKTNGKLQKLTPLETTQSSIWYGAKP